MNNERVGPFKVGDRVRHNVHGFTGTVVNDKDVKPDDLSRATELAGGRIFSGCWRRLDLTDSFELITTEPVAAQEGTEMKAYQWVIWSVEDGARTAMADQSEKMMPFKSADNAKLWAWQQFAKAGEDPDCFEVEVHPFGG